MSRFLKSGGGKASALLQKANAQLRGERVKDKATDEDDGLGAYLSSLGNEPTKTSQPDWTKFGELSDISISDAQDSSPKAAPVSKFVKKKPATENESLAAGKQLKKSPIKSAGDPHVSRSNNASAKGVYASKSSALSKVAAYTAKYSSQEKKKKEVLLSDSDLDMDLSMDEDVMADVRALKGSKPSDSHGMVQPTAAISKPKPASSQNVEYQNLSPPAGRPGSSLSLSDSSEIGKGGSKFLKKKPGTEFDQVASQPQDKKPASPKSPKSPKTPRASGGKKRGSMFTLKSAEKYSTQVVLDTDEESLADFIGGLNSSASSVQASASPSPRTPRHSMKSPLSARSPEPMEQIREVEDEVSEASRSEALTESYKTLIEESEVNVMDFDDLKPVAVPEKPKLKKAKGKVTVQSPPSKDSRSRNDKKQTGKKSKSTPPVKNKEKKKSDKNSSSNIFQSMGIQSVEDLFKSAGVDDASEEDSIEEIPDRPTTPLRSILSPTPRSAITPRSSQTRVRLSLGSLTEVRSRSPSPDTLSEDRGSINYTSEFDPTESVKSAQTGSESEAESIATQGTASSVSIVPTSRPRSARSRSRRHSEDYYSDDFTSGASVTDASERSRRRYSTSRSLSQDSATYSETYTSFSDSATERSRTPSPRRRISRSQSEDKPKKVKMRSQEIQTGLDTGSLYYHWNVDAGSIAMMAPPLGLGQVDPTPIASHVVSPDAIEAMTAYSPSVLALNDMLRQQLELTTSFLRTQRRMHQAYVGTTIPDHKYTTLSDTKDYIKRHKRKRLTFEEALRQVKLEMGMET